MSKSARSVINSTVGLFSELSKVNLLVKSIIKDLPDPVAAPKYVPPFPSPSGFMHL